MPGRRTLAYRERAERWRPVRPAVHEPTLGESSQPRRQQRAEERTQDPRQSQTAPRLFESVASGHEDQIAHPLPVVDDRPNSAMRAGRLRATVRRGGQHRGIAVDRKRFSVEVVERPGEDLGRGAKRRQCVRRGPRILEHQRRRAVGGQHLGESVEIASPAVFEPLVRHEPEDAADRDRHERADGGAGQHELPAEAAREASVSVPHGRPPDPRRRRRDSTGMR